MKKEFELNEWKAVLLLMGGVLIGIGLNVAVINSSPHTSDMKLYWTNYSLGGAPYFFCEKFSYVGDGLFDCETKSVGGFDYIGIEMDENSITEKARGCLND